MKQVLEIFVKNLKLLMERDDRNASWLAKKSGFTPRTIFRILALEGDPGIETLSKISEAMGVSFAEMITEPNKAEVLEKHEAKVADHAEMRKLMKLQIENDLYKHTLKKLADDVSSMKNDLEIKVAAKTIEIEDQKKKLNLVEDIVRQLDNSPASIERLRSIYGQNIPLSDTERLEAESLLEIAKERLNRLSKPAPKPK